MSEEEIWTMIPYYAEAVDNAANYAQQCYLNASGGLLDCGLFVSKSLPKEVDFQAPCPFHDEMCRTPEGNIRLDTGYIDSHRDLGLNAPNDQRFLWRNVLHCAPLVTRGFTSLDGSNNTRYHYGKSFWRERDGSYMHVAKSLGEQYTRRDNGLENTHVNYGLE